MALDLESAREHLKVVLDALWEQHHRPALGARLKTALVTQVRDAGAEFDATALGYEGFGAFVNDCDFATVRFRPGTDMLVVPSQEAESLDSEWPSARRRIRSDFWNAFVTFSRSGEIRSYSRASDEFAYIPPSVPPRDGIPVTPIPRETQLEWRTEFISTLEPGSPLESMDLSLDGAFARFSRGLPEDLRRRWNDFWTGKIKDVIGNWADENGVAETTWLIQPGITLGNDTATRRQLYAVLDQVPLDDLLEMTIPLKWLVRKNTKR